MQKLKKFALDHKPFSNSDIDTQNRDFRYKIWQLLPFFRQVFVYFVVVFLKDTNRLYLPSWGELFFKWNPIFTLSLFIYKQSSDYQSLQSNKYSFYIFMGMTLSWIGDCLLVFQEASQFFFLAGLIVFAAAHIFYTIGFRIQPFQFKMLAQNLFSAFLVFYFFMSSNLRSRDLVMKIGVFFYVIIIFVMHWRAWARLSYRDVVEGKTNKVFAAVGASFFMLSDAILGVNKFSTSLEGANYSIMGFYFLGQMLIALSVIDTIDRSPKLQTIEDESETGNSGGVQNAEQAIQWLM